jgi:hypothetical protein
LVGVIKTIKMLLYVLGKYLLFLKQTVLRRGKRTKMQFLRRVINPERGRTGFPLFAQKPVSANLLVFARICKKELIKNHLFLTLLELPTSYRPRSKKLSCCTHLDRLKMETNQCVGTIIECVISTFTAD